MARDSSPSGSSSSSGSPSASRSPSPPPVSAIASSSRSKPQSTSTHEYQPPDGYIASDLSSSALKHGAIAEQQQQVWLFKLPEGVNAADLDGLKLNVKGKKAKATSLRVKQDKYRLVEASSSSSHEDARNAQAGLSEKRAKREGEKSQLIDEDDAEGSLANASNVAEGAYLYLPTSSGRAGQVRHSKVPIAKRFELLLDVGAPQSQQQPVVEKQRLEDRAMGEHLTPAEARLAKIGKHRQMKGYFAPTGSLYDAGDDADDGVVAAPAPAAEPSHPLINIKPKDKKRKKADAEAEDKAAGAAAGAGATSPSPRKEKKAKKEGSGGEASVSKEARKASEKAASKERKKERKDKGKKA